MMKLSTGNYDILDYFKSIVPVNGKIVLILGFKIAGQTFVVYSAKHSPALRVNIIKENYQSTEG